MVCEAILKKYLRDSETNIEDVAKRIASSVALSKNDTKKLIKFMKQEVFTPASTAMINSSVDLNKKRDVHNCYLHKVNNDIIDIAKTYKDLCLLTANGGGIGLDISDLEPQSEGRLTFGIIGFMLGFHSVVHSTRQYGTNNGQICFYCDINHPEIEDFINFHHVKSSGDLTQKRANSFSCVKINNEFMEKVKSGCEKSFNLLKKITKLRFETGKPFIMFTDNCNIDSHDYLKENTVTMSNLCTEILVKTDGEQVGLCCLGSLNFDKYMQLDQTERQEALRNLVNIVHKIYNKSNKTYKSNQDKDKTLKNFDGSIGIGIFGWTDYTERLGVMYNDEDAVNTLCNTLDEINNIGLELGLKQVTAIAPTENISRLFNASQALDYYPFEDFIQKDQGRSVKMDHGHKHFGMNIDQTERIDFIAKVQKHVHQAISFTLMYTHEVSLQRQLQDIVHAWKSGIKTLYYVKTPPLRDAATAEDAEVSADVQVVDSIYRGFINESSCAATNSSLSYTGGSCCGA